MELTAAELTVLGLVIEQPRHGYDLEQLIERRGIRQWTDIGFSSIYYVLGKLEQRALIAAVKDGGAKSRRVFHATAEGRRVAADEAFRFIAELRAVPHTVLVGVANLAMLSKRDYREALRSRLTQLDARIAAVEDAARSQEPLPRPAREVFSYSLSLLRAERSWIAARAGDADA